MIIIIRRKYIHTFGMYDDFYRDNINNLYILLSKINSNEKLFKKMVVVRLRNFFIMNFVINSICHRY